MASVVPVAIKGFSVNSGLLGALVIGVFTLLGVIVKNLPNIQLNANARRKTDMDGLREDIVTIKSDAREAKDEARRVHDLAQRLENMVACMRPAISILTAEVKRLDPDNPNNPALIQVQELMAMAAAGDMGIGKAMLNLASVKGTGEP